jgi:hypothetical protein
MSNNNEWYEDDDDFLEEDDQTSGLTNLRKADRAKSKRIKELETELEGLRNFQRQSVVSSVLNERGVNPKIASFIPSDIANDSESIGQWLDEHGEVFGVQPQKQRSMVDQENLNALRQIDAATNFALSPDDVNDVFSRINNAQSADELMEMIYGADS